MKLSASYILPVIFCVLSHELWMVLAPPVLVVEEPCIEEEWNEPCEVELHLITENELCQSDIYTP